MHLFSRFALGPLELPNRVVMAPMTRSRASGNIPNDLVRDYYAQRASAGLIITEGVAPSPNGLGYARIPGLFSPEQVDGWKPVTAAVHARGGRIFAQLMHVGRIAHRANLPRGARIVAPSAVRASGQMYTDAEGMRDFPEPEPMSAADVAQARDEFVRAAENALSAGFDGIELHAANGYLLEQFLHPHTNRRGDAYGGGDVQRNRFVTEVARACAQAIGFDRVGVRLSPYGTFNDLPVREDAVAAYQGLADALQGTAYLHVIQSAHPRYAATLAAMRAAFAGPLMLNGGFERTSAESALTEGRADLISFGRPFIANPDFVARLRTGAPLAEPQPATFYTPGGAGYVDYPALAASEGGLSL